MKFALNGALTIGTLDGANVEIREEVGPKTSSCSDSRLKSFDQMKTGDMIRNSMFAKTLELREALRPDQVRLFHGDRDLFEPLVDSLLYHDEYLLLADYDPMSTGRMK